MRRRHAARIIAHPLTHNFTLRSKSAESCLCAILILHDHFRGSEKPKNAPLTKFFFRVCPNAYTGMCHERCRWCARDASLTFHAGPMQGLDDGCGQSCCGAMRGSSRLDQWGDLWGSLFQEANIFGLFEESPCFAGLSRNAHRATYGRRRQEHVAAHANAHCSFLNWFAHQAAHIMSERAREVAFWVNACRSASYAFALLHER